MITLADFIKLYKPEFVSDTIEIQLYTAVKVGDIKTTTKLGTFIIKDGIIKNLDMNKMIVEKFTIPNLGKPSQSVTCMEITVSDNPRPQPRNVNSIRQPKV